MLRPRSKDTTIHKLLTCHTGIFKFIFSIEREQKEFKTLFESLTAGQFIYKKKKKTEK